MNMMKLISQSDCCHNKQWKYQEPEHKTNGPADRGNKNLLPIRYSHNSTLYASHPRDGPGQGFFVAQFNVKQNVKLV